MVGKALQHSGDKLKREILLLDRKGEVCDKVYCNELSLDITQTRSCGSVPAPKQG